MTIHQPLHQTANPETRVVDAPVAHKEGTTNMSPSLRKLLVALLALVLVAAACGSDSATDVVDDAADVADDVADQVEEVADDVADEVEDVVDEPDAERGKVAYFSYANFNGFSQGIWTGVQAGAAEAGIEAEIFDGAFDFSGETQAQQIQNATLSGDFDTFVISSNNGAAITPAVEEAIAEGIAVVAVFSPIGPDQLTLDPQVDGLIFAGQSVIGSVEGQADLVVEACADRDPCNVAYLAGDPTLDIDQTRIETFESIFADTPAINLIEPVAGGYAVESGQAAADAVLLANEDVHVMFGSSQAILGAEQAAITAGAEGIAFIGLGSPTQAVEAVKEGRWYGLQLDRTADWGQLAVEVAGEQLAGDNPNPSIDVDALVDLVNVNQDTIGDFEGQWTN